MSASPGWPSDTGFEKTSSQEASQARTTVLSYCVSDTEDFIDKRRFANTRLDRLRVELRALFISVCH